MTTISSQLAACTTASATFSSSSKQFKCTRIGNYRIEIRAEAHDINDPNEISAATLNTNEPIKPDKQTHKQSDKANSV